MKDLFVLGAHLLATLAKLLGPGGARAVVADSLLMKQQLLIVNRGRTGTQSFGIGSIPARFLVAVPQPAPDPAVRRDCQAIHAAALPRSVDKVQVSLAVFIAQKGQAGT